MNDEMKQQRRFLSQISPFLDSKALTRSSAHANRAVSLVKPEVNVLREAGLHSPRSSLTGLLLTAY